MVKNLIVGLPPPFLSTSLLEQPLCINVGSHEVSPYHRHKDLGAGFFSSPISKPLSTAYSFVCGGFDNINPLFCTHLMYVSCPLQSFNWISLMLGSMREKTTKVEDDGRYAIQGQGVVRRIQSCFIITLLLNVLAEPLYNVHSV
jgi:hypothetical protein